MQIDFSRKKSVNDAEIISVVIPLPFSHWLSDDPQNTHRESNRVATCLLNLQTYLTRNSNGSLQVSATQGLDPVLFQTSCQCVRIVSGARTSTMHRSILRVVAAGQRLQSQLFPLSALVDRDDRRNHPSCLLRSLPLVLSGQVLSLFSISHRSRRVYMSHVSHMYFSSEKSRLTGGRSRARETSHGQLGNEPLVSGDERLVDASRQAKVHYANGKERLCDRQFLCQ